MPVLSDRKIEYLILLLYGVLAIALLSVLASNTFIPVNEDQHNHLASIVQAAMALQQGQLPLRITPWEHGGMGYPMFQFYAPLPYTLAAVFYQYFTAANAIIAYKLTLWMALVLGGMGIYLLAKKLTEHTVAAILAGVVYMTSPCLLNHISSLGFFSAVCAMGVLPMVLYTLYNVYTAPYFQLRLVSAAALALAALLLCHAITFFNAIIFIALWLILWRIQHQIKKLSWIIMAGGLAGLLTVWFWLPIVLMQGHLGIVNLLGNTLRDNSVSIFTLLSFASPVPLSNQMSDTVLTQAFYPSIGIAVMLAAAVCVYWLLANANPYTDASMRKRIYVLLGLLAFSVFLVWAPVNIWWFLPKIFTINQFSYRYLAMTSWLGALLMAYVLAAYVKPNYAFATLCIGFYLLALSAGNWLQGNYDCVESYADINQQPSLYAAAKDYLYTNPTARDFYRTLPTNLMPVSYGKPLCTTTQWITHCHFTVSQANTIVQLPVLYYPDLLDVKIDGKPYPYRASTHNENPQGKIIKDPVYYCYWIKAKMNRGPYYVGGEEPFAQQQKATHALEQIAAQRRAVDGTVLLTSVLLNKGSYDITAEFRGIVWANWVSGITAGLLLSYLLLLELCALYKNVRSEQ